MTRLILIVLTVVFLSFMGLSPDAHAKGDGLINGFLSNKYKFRTAGGDDKDHDAETLLSLDIGDLTTHKVSASFFGGAVYDLDGDNANSFNGIYDTYNKDAVPRLYHAYLDTRDIGPVNHMRLGRQFLYDFETLHFDGLSLESDPFYGFQVSAYGGVPVHLYENNMGIDPGDWLAGGALQWRPWHRIKLRFDFVHLTDKDNGFRSAVGDDTDNLLGVSGWYKIGSAHELYSRFTSFTDQVRDVRLGLSLNFIKEELYFRMEFYRLLKPYSLRVLDWDAYGSVGVYQPYTEGSLSATKWIGEKFSVNGGVVVRVLDDNQTTSAFNHGYERGYLSASTHDVFFKGLTLTLTGDYYHGEDNTLDNNTFAFSFDASQSLLDRRLTVSAGSAFYAYRYNLSTGNETVNARVFYTNIDCYIVKKALKAEFGYEFELNDFNNFHSLNAGLVWKF